MESGNGIGAASVCSHTSAHLSSRRALLRLFAQAALLAALAALPPLRASGPVRGQRGQRGVAQRCKFAEGLLRSKPPRRESKPHLAWSAAA